MVNAGPRGLEPPTSSLTGKRSNQLSYDPKQLILLYFSLLRGSGDVGSSVGVYITNWICHYVTSSVEYFCRSSTHALVTIG